MKLSHSILAVALSGLIASLASAQSGTLDQSSPVGPGSQSASFAIDPPSLTWQAQVRWATSGYLEGVRITLGGPVGSQVNLRIRYGAGWSTNPPVFSTLVTKTTAVQEQIFVDTLIHAIGGVAGTVMVLELQGNGTGSFLYGSYVDPAFGAPLYAEPLCVNGSSTCYGNCGWRLAFETYVESPPIVRAYCTSGTTAGGCTPTMSWIGTPSVLPSANFTLVANNVEPQKTGLIFYGVTGPLALPWAPGSGSSSWLCVKSPVQRMNPHNSGGSAPCSGTLIENWSAFIWAHPTAIGSPIFPGQPFWAQTWFRDPASPGTTSLSNGVFFVP